MLLHVSSVLKYAPQWAIILAVMLWSTSATSMLLLQDIPIVLLTALLLTCHGVVTVCRLTFSRKWQAIPSIPNKPWLWLGGVMGIVGNDFCYYYALRATSPVVVELLSWCWPFFVMLYVSRFQLSRQLCLGLLMGFAAVVLLQVHSWHAWTALSQHFHGGALLALGSALSWATYTLVSHHYADAPHEMVGLYAGCGALLAWGMYMAGVPHGAVHWHHLGVLVWLALGPATLAYQAWDYGISHGALQQATFLAYAIPLLSYSCLICTGFADFSWHGLASFLLLMAAILYNRDAWSLQPSSS